jgi:hypothetical protein
MAVGANPPPLFFERRAFVRLDGSAVSLRGWHFQENPGNRSASTACRGSRQSARPPATGRC